jgi:DNA-binding response OmpR family regulator
MGAILLLSNYNNNLIDLVYNLGLTPILKETMESALSTLRHYNFSAIIVDREFTNIDTLEFILNAWDVYSQVPVIVIDKSNESNNELAVLDQQKVFCLTKDIEDIEMEIAKILLDRLDEN